MKWLLPSLVVCVLAVAAVSAQARAEAPAPSTIKVDTLHADMMGGGVRLEARNGSHTTAQTEWNISTETGLRNIYRSDESYKVIIGDDGRLEVLAHVVFVWHGKTAIIDQKLPVLDRQLDRADWAQLGPHFCATAYFCAANSP